MNRSLPKLWIIGLVALSLSYSCKEKSGEKNSPQDSLSANHVTAKDLLGNPAYPAVAYGGYRHKTRAIEPTPEELKEDLKILEAMGIKVLKTFNVHYAETANLLKVIRELKAEEDAFEMYIMLGAWMNCENAWTDQEPNHESEDLEGNTLEIERAVALANQYSDIVKIIAVGNEAMVHWATSYYVYPDVILKWVNYLQELKSTGKLPKDLWITSSDNFASWGGGDSTYHVPALDELISAVDFVCMHTYPYLDTYYSPEFWGVKESEKDHSEIDKIELAVKRAIKFADSQYTAVADYVKRIDKEKPIHIGETGWATVSGGYFGSNGSKASDEVKQALYFKEVCAWSSAKNISCFFFEAFDEPWKDSVNVAGAENHFGLFTVDGQAKYALWNRVDQGDFEGLTRNGNAIRKTYGGDLEKLMQEVDMPVLNNSITSGF